METCARCGQRLEAGQASCADCGYKVRRNGWERIPKARLNALLIGLALSLCFAVFMLGFYWPTALGGWKSILGGGIPDLDGTPQLRLSGQGSQAEPYLIQTAEELERFAQTINSGDDHEGEHFLLTGDIDLSELLGGDMDGPGWRPIGNYKTEFRGIFDGGGHTVSGFWINTNGPANVGFFGYIDNAVIRNLNLRLADGGVRTKLYAGALVGFQSGENSRIINCSATGRVEVTQKPRSDGAYPMVGGLVGVSQGNIEDCWASVDVTVWGENNVVAGGLVGQAEADIVNCRSDGEVNVAVKNGYEGENDVFIAGGLAGMLFSGGRMERSYATGRVLARSDRGHMLIVGGLAGIIGEGAETRIRYCSASGDITAIGMDCLADNNPDAVFIKSSKAYAGGLIGVCVGGEITDSYADGSVATEYFTDVYAGGLVGDLRNNGIAARCYAAGSVRCVRSSLYPSMSGLIGAFHDSDGQIKNCYYDHNINQQKSNAAYVQDDDQSRNRFFFFEMQDKYILDTYPEAGRTAAEMGTQSTYEDWDFDDTWRMPEDGGPPCLR